jgi:hypothetical protein
MSNLLLASSFASPVKSQTTSSHVAPSSAPTASLKGGPQGAAASSETTRKISTPSPKKTVGSKQQAAAVRGAFTRRRSLFGGPFSGDDNVLAASPKRIRYDDTSVTTRDTNAAGSLPLPVADTSDAAVALLRGAAGRVVEVQLPRGCGRVGLRAGITWTCADLKARLALAHSADFPAGATGIVLLTRDNATPNRISRSSSHDDHIGDALQEAVPLRPWRELEECEQIPNGDDLLIKTLVRLH